VVEVALYDRTGEGCSYGPSLWKRAWNAGKGEATHSSTVDSKPVRRSEGESVDLYPGETVVDLY